MTQAKPCGASSSPSRSRRTENQCNNWASKKENVEAFYCKEGGGPPKGEVCKPTPAPVKAYSYNFETMQPTMSPTPQVP